MKLWRSEGSREAWARVDQVGRGVTWTWPRYRMLDKESGAIRRERMGPERIGGNYSRHCGCTASRREVHSDETGTAERASVKTASLRSLAFVRLQRLSRKSSGCMLVHTVLHASSKERVPHLRNRARNSVSVTNCRREARLYFARVTHLYGEKCPNGTAWSKLFVNLHSRYRCVVSTTFALRVWKVIIAVLTNMVKWNFYYTIKRWCVHVLNTDITYFVYFSVFW